MESEMLIKHQHPNFYPICNHSQKLKSSNKLQEFIMANSTKTIKSPGREYIFINLALYMKENLLMELSKEMEDKFSQTVLLIKANSLKEKDLEKEDFNGQMGKFMMVSGRKIENMGVVSGRILKDLHI